MSTVKISKPTAKTAALAVFLLPFFLLMNVWAQTAKPKPAMPQKTTLNKEEVNRQPANINYTYYYTSTLSKEEIISFYRNLFVSQEGLYEAPNLGADMLVFQKIPLTTAVLSFMPSSAKEKTDYFINIVELIKLSVLPASNFMAPKPLDFMPVYSNATQFLYYAPSTSAFIGIGYLTASSPEEVQKFYLGQMLAGGWQLTSQEPHSGTFEFSQWLKFVDPYTKMLTYHNFAAGYSKIVPPLKIRGATFDFEQGKKKCTVAVYKFEDMLEKAKAIKTVWDVSPLEQYGDTIIEVYYFY